MSVRAVLADYHQQAIRMGNPSTARMAIYTVAKAMGRFPLDMHDAEFALYVERVIEALVSVADEQQKTLTDTLMKAAPPPFYVCAGCGKDLGKRQEPSPDAPKGGET